jgi:hypothetical protein
MAEQRRAQQRRVMGLRWVLVALSGILAVALVAAGAVVIGVVIGVMAVVRTVMLLQWRRRAAAFRPGARHVPPVA